MSHDGGEYIFDPAWEHERSRLRALEAMCDSITIRHLAAIGVGAGWRCLEVAGGAGSITRWLSSAVGESGSVVVTDQDVRFLEELASDRVEVRRHDIRSDPLEEGAYDVVHARSLLEHLAAPDEVVTRLVRALRPGGTLLLESLHFGGPATAAHAHGVLPPEMGPPLVAMIDAAAAAFRSIGADPGYAIRLPAVLIAAGLADVDAEIACRLIRGRSDAAQFYRLSYEQLGPRLVAAGAAPAEVMAQLGSFFNDPDACWPSEALVSAWGRQPDSN
jgi:SAM-dependent methyltransferase